MNVCASCFADEEIKRFINTSSTTVAKCDCCGQESNIVDLGELSDFFTEFLGLFQEDDNGEELIHRIRKDWKIFSSDIYGRKILSAVMDMGHVGLSVNDNVSYSPEIQDCFLAWEKLKSEVRREKRYFPDVSSFNWESYITSNARIKKGSHLYRARITPAGQGTLSPADMGCPPAEQATAGRANPLGIPYLYLCDKETTTYYEVRAVYLDKLTIGEFEVVRDLNIVDFSNEINLFYTYSVSESDTRLIDIVKRKIIFDEISSDLSRPLRRFDTEIEYVPTQLICEYCKINGADGIRFNSSLHKGGVNVVLFNGSDAKCTKVRSQEINSVK